MTQRARTYGVTYVAQLRHLGQISRQPLYAAICHGIHRNASMVSFVRGHDGDEDKFFARNVVSAAEQLNRQNKEKKQSELKHCMAREGPRVGRRETAYDARSKRLVEMSVCCICTVKRWAARLFAEFLLDQSTSSNLFSE